MIDQTILRTLYTTATTGEPASRTLARNTIKLLLLRAGLSMRQAFKDAGLDLNNYMETRP